MNEEMLEIHVGQMASDVISTEMRTAGFCSHCDELSSCVSAGNVVRDNHLKPNVNLNNVLIFTSYIK